MPSTFTVKEFTGPLDVLLALIEEKKMDISELSISAVTDQFLSYLDELEEKHPEELADFLLVATRLLLMKAKALLPELIPEEESGVDLAEQLRLYKRFVEASREINARWTAPNRAVARYEAPRLVVNPAPPENVTGETLSAAMTKLVDRLRPPKPLPRTTIDRTVSLKEKIDTIRIIISSRKNISFFKGVADPQNRTDLIVSFLALLELMKQRLVALEQPDLFGDIGITKA